MGRIEITKEEARNFLIKYHGLDSKTPFEGEQGVLEYVNKVGCIQYDPLNVVGRNADLVLQSRIRNYQSFMLEKLLYKDRLLIDGWDKMMSIYSVNDWSHFSRIRENKEKQITAVLEYRNSSGALDIVDEIKDILQQEGPLQSSKISIGQGGKGSWGHRKLSSAALDYMFNKGELGIHSKKNTQKIYDLIENLLPREILNKAEPFENDTDFYKWYVIRRVGSVGILWARNGGGWLGYAISKKKLRESIINELVEEGLLVKVYVDDISEPFFIRKQDIHMLDSISLIKQKVVRFLAPLDNLMWDRDMVEKLFNFNYRWEVYTPIAKRKYGYYVLPVLYGNKFIARFEPEMQRGNNPVQIKNWWWEEDVVVTSEMKEAIYKGLDLFCDYLQADGICESSLSKITSC